MSVVGSHRAVCDFLRSSVVQNVENVLTPEGAGLVTALRVLCHIACPPPAVEGQSPPGPLSAVGRGFHLWQQSIQINASQIGVPQIKR